MMDNERTIRVLEYDKIRSGLANLATSEPGRSICERLLPMTNEYEIQAAQEEERHPDIQRRNGTVESAGRKERSVEAG